MSNCFILGYFYLLKGIFYQHEMHICSLFFFRFLGNTAFVILSFGLFLFIFSLYNSFSLWQKFLKYLAPLIPFCIILLLRANGFVIFITAFSILTYLTACIYLFSNGQAFYISWLELFWTPFRLLAKYVYSLPVAMGIVKRANAGGKTASKNRYFKIIIKGLILAAPILAILISLLTAADPIYGKFINNLFNIKINWSEKIIQRIIFSLIFFFILLPLLYFRASERRPSELRLGKISLVSEMAVVMFLVALTLLSFLVIQFPYVFVSVPRETDLAQFGVKTYSEYVRRGFFELLFAAIVVYGAVLAGLVVWRNSNSPLCHSRPSTSLGINSGGDPGSVVLRILQLTVLTELFIFIFSLYRRIWLYQSLHGWSLVRLYGAIFLFWLTGFTISLALRHLIIRRWVIKEIAFSFFVILFLGFFNAEDFIAKSGHPPTVNGRVDYVYLSRMSPDGYAGWKMAHEYVRDVLILRNLQNKTLINREERREVAYAGRIVYELSKNYNSLIMRHEGQYWIFEYFLRLAHTAKKEKQNFVHEKEELDELIFELENSRRIEKGTYLGEKGKKRNFNIFVKNQGFVFNVQKESNQWLLFGAEYMHNQQFPQAVDNYFMWNYSSSAAYHLMNKEINITNLLDLQK